MKQGSRKNKIISVITSEKSQNQSTLNKYFFKVDPSCSKPEIYSIIKSLFKGDVENVNLLNVKPKTRKFRNVFGKTKSFKKAIVTVKKDQKINFNNQ